MKKEASIVFQVNFTEYDEKNSSKTNRFFSLYRQLRRKRQLARFCREAFIEKAIRHLGGQNNSYQQLDRLIKSKGVVYILESIKQTEAQLAEASAHANVDAILQHETGGENDETPNLMLQVSATLTEPTPELPATEAPEDSSIQKIDLEKLKGLL